MSEIAIRVEGLTKHLRRARSARAASISRVPQGNGLQAPGTERRRARPRPSASWPRSCKPDGGRRRGARARRRQPRRRPCAAGSAWPVSTRRSTRTSPAARTCAWSGSCGQMPTPQIMPRAAELLEKFRAERRGRPTRAHVFGRHAAAAGHRRVADDAAARPVPGRADHRPGPHQPQRAVGDDPSSWSPTGPRSC